MDLKQIPPATDAHRRPSPSNPGERLDYTLDTRPRFQRRPSSALLSAKHGKHARRAQNINEIDTATTTCPVVVANARSHETLVPPKCG